MHGDGTGFEDEPTLAEALRDGPLTVDDAIRTSSAVADAVAALHAAGRAHGGFGPEDVVLGAHVRLLGPDAPKRGLAAPLAVRSRDLRGVGAVLAAALGWPAGETPAAVADLVERAERSDAPAAALADALHRLRRDPLAVPGLLPPRREPAPAPRVAGIVPRPDRRTTGVAAVVVAGAAAVGAVLLLLGAPAGPARTPIAAAEPTAAAVAPETGDAVVAAAQPTAAPSTSRPAPTRTPVAVPAPRAVRTGTAIPARRFAAPAATAAPAPVAAPRPTPTSTPRPTAPSSAAPTPQPTAAPTSTPAPPAPSAPPSPTTRPSPPPTSTKAPAPAPPAPRTSAPAATTAPQR